MKRYFFIALAFVAFAGCEKNDDSAVKAEAQVEIPADAVDYFSHMNVRETAGSKGQVVLLQSGETVWFDGIRQLLTYLRLPETANQPMSAYASLSDMEDGAEEWHWLAVDNLYFVQTDKAPELIAKDDYFTFADEDKARAFAASHGGKVLRLADITDADLGL